VQQGQDQPGSKSGGFGSLSSNDTHGTAAAAVDGTACDDACDEGEDEDEDCDRGGKKSGRVSGFGADGICACSTTHDLTSCWIFFRSSAI